jgi:indolepyruvate ferredoxin oxidoreductase
MALREVALTDKYTVTDGRIFLTGTQALVRLPIMQHLRDQTAGLNTGCYISGYRGSPLGMYDQQLWAAEKHLKEHNIVFQSGVNEDIAATALWGSQQVGLHGKPKYDGVFGIWYGKGPGVDRTGDVFRHANLAGTNPNGGVLVLMGDDHTSESSTTAHQSEYALVDAMIPILNPAGVQELLDYGLIGWALSRYASCWVGLKSMKDTIDASATVDVSPERVHIITPTEFAMPEGGLSWRFPDTPLEQEARLHNYKIPAVLAFARANQLNKRVMGAADARLGIVTCGKSYLDVRQALQYLGIDENEARRLGVSIFKVAMPWPLEPTGIREFAEGLDKIIVVEEKRGLMEGQVKEILYKVEGAPEVVGKRDELGKELFQSIAALDPNTVSIAVGQRILARTQDAGLAERVAEREAFANRKAEVPAMERTPYFCSGCPHNTGTRLPDGSIALSGIGCHFMAQWMDRNTSGYTQMGGEGASWMGEAPFVDTAHVFQNIGDGTYYHSGLLAVRAAVASGVNMTYKILYNDAVAMTGGQQVDGQMTVPQITQQVAAEGARKVVVVTDEPEKYGPSPGFAEGVEIYHRDDYDKVQKDIRDVKGISVIVYDQTCGTEKRRRRKRNEFPDPKKRVVINDLVCEGCGDCGVASNCVSVSPLETEFGRKRTIDQSSCNKDYSCVKGFCPSFVTVHGGELKKGSGAPVGDNVDTLFPAVSEPELPTLDNGAYAVLVNGIGGTGVVTIGAIIGMAAHLEGKAFNALDMAGLAQKGGSVWSHLQFANEQSDIGAARIGLGGASAMIGCDFVTSASETSMDMLKHGKTRALVNLHQQMTGDFTRNLDAQFPAESLQQTIAKGVGKENAQFVEGTRIATALMGNSIATNMFMLGMAYQKGLIPIGSEAISKAIELNGVAVKMNQTAFLWGRRAAVDLAAVERLITPKARVASGSMRLSQSLDEMIERRESFLTAYQDATYARRYRALVDKVRDAEAKIKGHGGLAEAVARYYFKLLAYKDEYEVARLYTDGLFKEKVASMFEGDYKLHFHLAPPLFAKRNPETGALMKSEYGGWALGAFKLLAKLKFLRGGPLDVFGYTAERRTERQLIAEYESTVSELISALSSENHALAVRIASIPEDIRGYGHVKERNLEQAQAKRAEMLSLYREPGAGQQAAA